MKILWIPHTGWHIPQRAHSFCYELSKRHEVHVTDWVADFSKPRDYLSTRYLRNFTYREYRDGNIQVHGIPRISPALYLPTLRRFNSWIFSEYLQKIIDTYHIEVVVGTYIAPPPKAPRLIFDLFDDNVAYWRDYRKNNSYAKEIENTESEYLQLADQIVTIGSVLAKQVEDKIGIQAGKIRIIPNGVDLKRFSPVDEKELRKALGLEGKQIIGYISSFGEFSGLPRLIEAFLSINNPNKVLLLVGDGPQLDVARKMVENYQIRNVIFHGKVPQAEIHHYYNMIDIGVIPFDKTAFTDAACPIKLLEYSAAYKVVVCSKLSEVQQMGFMNVIYANAEASSWAEGINAALNTPFNRPSNLEWYDIHHLTKEYETVLRG